MSGTDRPALTPRQTPVYDRHEGGTPMSMTAQTDLAGDRAERRRRSLAATFRPDPQLEGLLALRRRDPAGFRLAIDPQFLMALGIYQAAKEAHDADDR